MGVRSMRYALTAAAVCATAVALPASAGHSAFPGGNGWIATGSYDNVWLERADGTRWQKLKRPRGVGSGEASQRVAWSRDGKKLLVSLDSEIYVVDAHGVRLPAYPVFRKLSAPAATWSRDGGGIVYRNWSRHCSGALVEYRLRDKARTQITPCDGASVPAWSPTSGYIAYRSRNGLQLLDRNSGAITTLTTHARSFPTIGGTASSGVVSWSPDGTQLAYSNDDSKTIEAYSLTTKTTRTIIPAKPDPQVYMGSVAWSPDGQKIAYTRDFLDAKYEEGLFVANIDGSNERPLLNYAFGPDWQPLPK